MHGRRYFTVNNHRAVLARFCTEPRVGRALTVTSLVVSATSATYIRNGTRAREKLVPRPVRRSTEKGRKERSNGEGSTGGVWLAGGSSFREVFLSPGPLNTVYVQGSLHWSEGGGVGGGVNRPARVDLTECSRGVSQARSTRRVCFCQRCRLASCRTATSAVGSRSPRTRAPPSPLYFRWLGMK